MSLPASDMDPAEVAERLEAMRQQMLAMQQNVAQIGEIKKAQKEQKVFARKAAIKAECDKYPNKVRVWFV